MLIAWILGLLTATEPNPPWKDTYEATAAVMAESAEASPLFEGRDGPRQTAALYVSLSWFESRHNPKAEGDCTDEKRTRRMKCSEPGAVPHSFCFAQINDTNFAGLGVTKESLLDDPRVCARAMHAMIRRSFAICTAKPLEDRLSWYATGGDGCRVVKESGNRMRKAQWLFATYSKRDQ